MDNIVLLLIEIVKVIGPALAIWFAYQASQRAKRSIEASEANATTLAGVAKAVDGLTTARVKSEKDLGDANAEIARGAGRDEQRAVEAVRAAAIAEGQKMGTQIIPETKPVEVEVVKTTPVDVKQSVPIEIKKGK